MLTHRSTPRAADDQPPDGWIETRFWVGTFGVFVTTSVLGLVASTFLVSLVLGYRPIAVTSGSMEPGISVGDVVLYEPHRLSGIGEGAVIVFDDPTIDGGTIIHRVVATDPDTGWLQTQGDANADPDSTWVTEDDIKGVAKTLIPYVGTPAAWVQTGRYFAASILIAFIALAAWVARWGWNTRYDPWGDVVAVVDADDDIVVAPVVINVSGIGLLAAGLLRIVALSRARTLGERRPGTMPAFDPPQDAEALLHRSADRAALNDVDAVLRHMAAGLATTRPTPTIVGLAVKADRIDILLGQPHPNPPAPFVVGADEHSWVVDRDVGLDHATNTGVAPMPALVTIGHTSRSLMVLDLEHAGVVNLTGPPDEITATMATMALELATSPLADSIEILCVGFGSQLAGLERVTVADDIIDAARRIAAHDADAAELAAAARMTALQGRVQGIGGDAWAPLVVFAPSPSHAAALAAAASSTPAAGVTAVITGDDDAAWQMRLAAENIQIPHLKLTLRRHNLTAVELATICDLIEDARNPAVSEGPDLVAVITSRGATVDDKGNQRETEEADTVDQQTPIPDKPPWDVDYVVEILGGLRVTRAKGEVVRFERSACPDLLAYLTQHRSGVTIDTTMEALWPTAEPNQRRANNIGSIARSTLGTDPEGNVYLPKVGIDGLYRVSERVGCDYDRFADLVDYATNLQPADAVVILREALSLVRGAPFDGTGNSDWAHLTGLYTEAVLAIDEAARTMATLALDFLDRPDDATWATTRGLQANPASSELYLLRLRAAISRSDGLEADAVYLEYQTVMEIDDEYPEADSRLDERMAELYESYRHSKRWVEAS